MVDRNLVRKSISAPDPTPEGQYSDDYGDDSPDDEGQIVWKGFVDVKGDPGQHTTTVFPLGAVLEGDEAGRLCDQGARRLRRPQTSPTSPTKARRRRRPAAG